MDPVRGAHCDYPLEGLRRVHRHTRTTLTEAAREAIEAQDHAEATGQPYDGPRFAAYSVWRPLATVRRDPLALCDATSMDANDLVALDYLYPCPDRGSGKDFVLSAYTVKPSKATQQQRWFWLPDQTSEDVWLIKLADSEAEASGGRIARGAAHCSPNIDLGGNEAAARESVEMRVACFW